MIKTKNKIFIGVAIGLTITLLLIGVFISVLAINLFTPTNGIDNKSPQKREEMTKIILEWGRLAPFPNDIKDYTVKTEGNMYTRTFEAKFISSPEELKQWIANSPGLSDATIEELDKNIKIYRIKPGAGASMANVKIDLNKNAVTIYVSWS